MKALLLQDYDQLIYTDVPDPAVEPGEVIPPIIMGHEAAGAIVAIGSEVKEWQVGDRVTYGCA